MDAMRPDPNGWVIRPTPNAQRPTLNAQRSVGVAQQSCQGPVFDAVGLQAAVGL